MNAPTGIPSFSTEEERPPHPRYQIELANKVRNGRAVGNLYVVTRRPEGCSTIIFSADTREEAQAWIDRGGEEQPRPLPTPVEFWTGVRDRSRPGSPEHSLATANLDRIARFGSWTHGSPR